MLTVTRPIAPSFERLSALLRQMLQEQRYTNGGPLVSLLELKLRELCAAQQLVLVANGTLAIELALKGLGIAGRVITTPFTFCGGAHAISWVGATPVYVDVDPETLTIDPVAIEAAIEPGAEAILGVHVYGQPCRVAAIDALARRHGLAVVYDGAHAFGSHCGGVPIGAFGDATTYSFHATKLFHTGEGGAIETRDPALAERLRRLRNFGIASEDVVTEAGINAKMSELAAATGLAVLDRLAEEIAARAALRRFYLDRLSNLPGVAPFVGSDETARLLYFVLRVSNEGEPGRRDRLHARLKAEGILARRYFYPLASELTLGADRAAAETPNAFAASREVLALPFHGGVSPADAERVAGIFRRFAEGR